MKNTLTILRKIFFLFSFFFALFANAQAPEKMSYQAVIRNASNALVTNQSIGMRISILQTTATGTAVYVETQTTTTNANGLASIEIGAGTVVSGTFANINWAADKYFIKTETDPTGGTNYTITGTSQLLSTPYALYAKKAGNSAIYDLEVTKTDASQILTPPCSPGTARKITFNNIVTNPTVGSWNSSTNTYTANQAGLYLINAQLISDILDPTQAANASITVNANSYTNDCGVNWPTASFSATNVNSILPAAGYLDINGAGDSSSAIYGSNNTGSSGVNMGTHRGRFNISTIVKLNANDTVSLRAHSSNSSIHSRLIFDGSCFLKIAKLN